MIGFDYGTSNCAVGVMDNNQPKILTLGDHGRFVPSTLYAPSRDVIVHWLQQQLGSDQQELFKVTRQRQLQKSQNVLRELHLDGISPELSFGKMALSRYLEEPDEGYYIKSPKSFLGASGLVESQIQLFEEIVAAMMSNIKNLAEEKLQKNIEHTVIGRPINFQGLKGEASNQQAITILTNAAKRIGYKYVEFEYEPVAAGFEFEETLQKETKVLVVDIGGGTTDCSMLLMGPQLKNHAIRKDHLLAHSGVRIGGNDFDIQLALKGIMPSLGMNSLLKTGKPMPVNSFNQAVSINNVIEQTEFYSAANKRFLQQLQRDAKESDLIERLINVHDHKLSHMLVNNAEQAKIALTENMQQVIDLSELSAALTTDVDRPLMLNASNGLLKQIGKLINEAIEQASCQPEVMFVTGGSAKSPMLKTFLSQHLPHIPIIVGDHFGSVTAGLTRCAHRKFS
jgi:hypothetical chaperone protein